MPFVAKRKVVEAAFNACILYGCEAWLGTGLRVMESLYMSAIKALLGVRQSTPNTICLIEAGMLRLKTLVMHRQKIFYEYMLKFRSGMTDDPLIFALELTKMNNLRTQRYIDLVINTFSVCSDKQPMSQHVLEASGTRSLWHQIYYIRQYEPSTIYAQYLCQNVYWLFCAGALSCGIHTYAHFVTQVTNRDWQMV